jgi:hypothetical protein
MLDPIMQEALYSIYLQFAAWAAVLGVGVVALRHTELI